jgi:hypothetical protein
MAFIERDGSTRRAIVFLNEPRLVPMMIRDSILIENHTTKSLLSKRVGEGVKEMRYKD